MTIRLEKLATKKMADSRSSKEGSTEGGGHGSATGSSSPTDDSSHSSPAKVIYLMLKGTKYVKEENYLQVC